MQDEKTSIGFVKGLLVLGHRAIKSPLGLIKRPAVLSQKSEAHDLAETDAARPGYIMDSDRYSRASWERQGSGWM